MREPVYSSLVACTEQAIAEVRRQSEERQGSSAGGVQSAESARPSAAEPLLGVWQRDGIGGEWRRWHKNGRPFECSCGRPGCPGHVEG